MKKLDIHLKNLEKEKKINTKKVEGKKTYDKIHPRLEFGRADVVESNKRELRKLVKVWAAKGVKWMW